MLWLVASLFTNVTCVPSATVSVDGHTVLFAITTVLPSVPHVCDVPPPFGLLGDALSPPHAAIAHNNVTTLMQ